MTTKKKDYKTFENAAQTPIEPPSHCQISSDDELEVWYDLVSSRGRDYWPAKDLMLLARVAQLECRIRKFDAKMMAEGIVIENCRGTSIENPLFRCLDTMRREQLSIIRALGLTSAKDTTEAKVAGKNEKEIGDGIKKNTVSLLAMPE